MWMEKYRRVAPTYFQTTDLKYDFTLEGKEQPRRAGVPGKGQQSCLIITDDIWGFNHV